MNLVNHEGRERERERRGDKGHSSGSPETPAPPKREQLIPPHTRAPH